MEALMKFCTSCGNEMFDDAVICTKCGRMAAMPQFQQPAPRAPQPTPVNQAPVQGQGVPATKSKAINLAMTILSFVSSVLNSIALFFLVGSSFYYKFTKIYIDNYAFYLRDELVFTAFAFFIASSVISLSDVILSTCSRERLEKLLPKIAKFVFSFLLMLAYVLYFNLTIF